MSDNLVQFQELVSGFSLLSVRRFNIQQCQHIRLSATLCKLNRFFTSFPFPPSPVNFWKHIPVLLVEKNFFYFEKDQKLSQYIEINMNVKTGRQITFYITTYSNNNNNNCSAQYWNICFQAKKMKAV